MFLRPIASIPDLETIPLPFSFKLYGLEATSAYKVTDDDSFAISKNIIITFLKMKLHKKFAASRNLKSSAEI